MNVLKDKDGNSTRKRIGGRGKKAFWIALAVVLAVGVGSLLGERGWRERRRWGGKSGTDSLEGAGSHLSNAAWRALYRIDATEDQKRRVQSVLSGFAPELVSLERERQALTGRLLEHFASERPDPVETERLRVSSRRLAERAIEQGFRVLFELEEILTPQQRQEFLAAWEER